MIIYKEYEKTVYNWLSKKNDLDNNFTFSLRRKGSKGAELDYFIGTEKSGYFAVTFWSIPVAYPGSSSDCIDLIFKLSKDYQKYSYDFKFTQTNSPDNKQNKSVLNLLKSLSKPIVEEIGTSYVSDASNKMFTVKTKPNKENYASLDEMLEDIGVDLLKLIPIINNQIEVEKKLNPEFEANRITKEDFANMKAKLLVRFDKYGEQNMTTMENVKEKFKASTNTNLNFYKAPLNQIFYGPPGTGKTYNTILEAAKIIEQDDSLEYAEAQEVFNHSLGDHIEFITFHQNYSYEDFIQGLRPDTELSGELSFFKSDGVFKRIADRALKNLKESKNPESAKKEFEEVFNALTKPLNEGDVDELVIKMKQTSFYITEIGEKSIEFRKNQGDSKHTLSINTLRKMYENGANDLILGGLQPYYNPILNLLLQNGKQDTESIAEQNYVIIIDEINRANISRVFGELITLIEKDKRFGGAIPLTATLPSGEKFIVPSNLYIIGTMNTADKSIALLDIALRRRFEFVAMYPKYVLENSDLEINDTEILKKLNKEIISRKGYDFTIGHSYFMGADYNLKNTIDTKVIPLLLEYFMNDFEEVKKILQAVGLVIDGWPMKLVKND